MSDIPPPNVIVTRARVNNAWLKEQKEHHANVSDRIGADACAVRKEKGLSLRQVAGKMGVSYPFLGDLERGHRHWTTETAEKWQKAIESFL